MILAEALNLRADLQKRIAQVKERINDNVKVQEGDEPIEAPQELFKELDDLFAQLQEIIYRINKTNMTAVIDGKTLTEWIAARDVLKLKIAAYRGAINNSLLNRTGTPVTRFDLSEPLMRPPFRRRPTRWLKSTGNWTSRFSRPIG